MAAEAKLTPEQWQAVRDTWEGDARTGYAWIVAQMTLPVSDKAVRKRAIKDVWAKRQVQVPVVQAAPEGPKVPKVPARLSLVPKVPADGEPSADGPKLPWRPTLYREEYDQQAYELCILGYTNDQIGAVFEVTRQTIDNWSKQHPSFFDALKRGKAQANAKVAVSLYQRAIGYSHPDVHVSAFQGDVTITKIEKHYPPETGAAIMFLKNREPELWRDKVEIQEDVNLNIFPPREILESLHAESLRRAGERAAMLTNRRDRLGVLIDANEDIDDAG